MSTKANIDQDNKDQGIQFETFWCENCENMASYCELADTEGHELEDGCIECGGPRRPAVLEYVENREPEYTLVRFLD